MSARRRNGLGRAVAGLLLAATAVHGSALPGSTADGEAAGTGERPPFALTVEQLFAWTPSSQLTAPANRATVALAHRFVDPDTTLDRRMRVMYAPDGMNNLADRTEPARQFNLFTFAHWSQIDILLWFAGTADSTVNIPAAPWVDTAHRNGVKVIGTVYFGQRRYGASADTVEAMLRRDPDGHFPAVDRLLAIARYYGFDGWMINAETDLRMGRDPVRARADAAAMRAFLRELTARAGKTMEIHVVEALLPDGSMHWQNGITRRNADFLLSPPRVSDGVWLNYWWTAADLRRSSRFAEVMGRSRYDLFVGADLGPDRENAQAAFRNRRWIRELYQRDGRRALTSLGLFGTEFAFMLAGDKRTPIFSRFRTDPTDVRRFYDAETRLFAGDDRNVARRDPSPDWPGLSFAVPARSVITSLPFATSFNTGHGRLDAKDGRRIGGAWFDMRRQDILPTWQFAYLGSTADVGYDFDRPFDGGSALRIAMPRARRETVIPLYLTRLDVQKPLRIAVTAITGSSNRFSVQWTRSDGSHGKMALPPSPTWRTTSLQLQGAPGTVMTRIAVTGDAGEPASVSIGRLEVNAKGYGRRRNGLR